MLRARNLKTGRFLKNGKHQITKICPICNNLFTRYASVAKIRKVCSRKCAQKHNTFKDNRVEKVCLFCKKHYKVYPNKKESKYCSIECRINYVKEHPEVTPKWKGGISFTKYRHNKTQRYKNFRKLVFERDNFTCLLCGKNTGNVLNAHHIKHWKDCVELRYVVNNAITLCEDCHRGSHKAQRQLHKIADHMYGKGLKKEYANGENAEKIKRIVLL